MSSNLSKHSLMEHLSMGQASERQVCTSDYPDVAMDCKANTKAHPDPITY